MDKRDRRYRTFRLRPAEKTLMQSLGSGEDEHDRYHALLNLLQVVDQLKLPDIRNETRQALRLGIPTQLDAAIKVQADKTGQAYVDILLAATREYRQSQQKALEARKKTTRGED